MIIHNAMKRMWRSKPFLAAYLMAAISIVISGCGIFSTLTESSKGILERHKSADGNLTKKAGLAVFGLGNYSTGYNPNRFIQTTIRNRLQAECPDVVLVTSEDETYADLLNSPPRHASGRINNYQLSQKARKLGLNAIITGAPVDIHEEIEETGILWFKGTENFARINVSIDIYDTSTAAKLLGDNIIRKIETDIAGLDNIRARAYDRINGLVEMLQDAADEAADKTCKAIREQSWRGYLISVDEYRIALSSGKLAGLAVGDVLDVYSNQDTIEGAEGQRFYLPGQKIGEIRITDLADNRAEAVLISGADLAEGDLVKAK